MKAIFQRLAVVVVASLSVMGCSGSDGGGNGGGGGPKVFPAQPVWQPSGSRVSWGGFSFNVPQGMAGVDRTDHYDMADNLCAITVTQPMAATGDLAQQANDILTSAYEAVGYTVLDDNYGTDLIGNRTQGRSAAGWEYVELRAELRQSGPSDERGHILLVRLGNQVVPFIGYSPTTAGCTQLAHDFTTGIVGELRWREIEYSLDFVSAPRNDAALASAIIGHWSLFQGPSGQEYVFAANGRYQYWGGLSQVHDISDTEIEIVTSHFTGDGAYAVRGDQVAVFPDGRPAESMLFRVYDKHAVSPSMQVSTTPRLGLMRRDSTGAYEVPLERAQ
ncbi:MAG TPA: hypothetical protein VLT82_06435 [Myxococcaceae bacterium]|nr:hypothetical protein [Myxococcaceae bacterium]